MNKPTNYSLLALVLGACLLSCSNNYKRPTINDVTALREKLAGYIVRADAFAEQHDGFIEGYCDSLLFSSLYASAFPPRTNLNVERARLPSGQWLRRATTNPCCLPGAWPDDYQCNEISNDMFIGLAWYIWSYRRADMIEELIDYGESHNWIMGRGEPFRVVMRPSLAGTLYTIRYRLSHVFSFNIYMPIGVSKWSKGFEAHLAVLHTLLRADLEGSIDDDGLEYLKHHMNREPNNPFFSAAYHLYVDGDQSHAIKFLLDESHYPKDGYPTSLNRCNEWLWQRDFGPDWRPCPERREIYSGADFVWLASIILNHVL